MHTDLHGLDLYYNIRTELYGLNFLYIELYEQNYFMDIEI